MKLALALFFALIMVYVAMAQRVPPKEAVGYLVVATCGTLPAPAYVAGSYASATVDVTGKLCTSQ